MARMHYRTHMHQHTMNAKVLKIKIHNIILNYNGSMVPERIVFF